MPGNLENLGKYSVDRWADRNMHHQLVHWEKYPDPGQTWKKLFQCCFKGISSKFQECFKKISRAFKNTSKVVSKKIEGCFNGVLSGFQICLKEVQ